MKQGFFITGFLVFGFLFLMSSCGGIAGSAAPQTSIPIPEGRITISSPNGEGYVVVTGALNAVPESAIVLAHVGSASSSVSQLRFATADVVYVTGDCTSSLPDCPEMDSNNDCQYTASADGSFSFLLSATESSAIDLSYIDPDSCQESDPITVTADSQNNLIDSDVVASTFDEPNGLIYLLGLNSSSEVLLHSYSIDTETVGSQILSGLTLSPETDAHLAVVRDEEPEYHAYMVIETPGQTLIGNLSVDGFDSDSTISVVDDSGESVSNLRFLATYQDVRSSFLFFYFFKDGVLYMSWISGSLTVGNLDDNGNLVLTQVTWSISVLESEFSGITTSDVNSVPYFLITEKYVTMLLGISDNGGNKYVLLRTPNDSSDFSMGYLYMGEADTVYLTLGTSIGNVEAQTILEHEPDLPDDFSTSFFRQDEQKLSDVKIGYVTLICARDTYYLSSVSAYESDDDCDYPDTQDESSLYLSDLAVSDVVLTRTFYTTDYARETLLVGSNGGSIDFITNDDVASQLKSSQIVNTIDPVGLEYDRASGTVFIIDAGVGDDGFSSVISYPLAGSPW